MRYINQLNSQLQVAELCFLEKHRETFVERSCYWKHLAVLQRQITIRWGFHLQLSPRITQTARLTNLWWLCSMIMAHSPHLNPEIQGGKSKLLSLYKEYDQTVFITKENTFFFCQFVISLGIVFASYCLEVST